MKSVNRQILPANSDGYLDVPGVDGSYLFPGDLRDRFIEVEFTLIKSQSLTTLRSTARQISAWLRTRERAQLIFDDEPDVYYMAKVPDQIDLEPMNTRGKLKVVFRCLPYAYSMEDAGVLLDSEILLDSDILIGGNYSFEITGNSVGEIYNSGTALYPQIEVIGNFNTFSIVANGVTFGYSAALVSQTLQINEDNKKTVKIGATNKLAFMTGDFIKLLPGNNTITISGTGLNCIISIIFKNKYL